jgi:hypothetical protein
MSEEFKTSFIPKKSLEKVSTSNVSKGISLPTVVALVIFFAVVLTAIGVFSYEKILTSNIASKSEQLRQAQEAFDTELIAELQRLDKKIQSANLVLDRHIAVSPLFELLEQKTLKSIRFTSFEYLNIGGEVKIQMNGEAEGFASIALQSDIFGDDKYILEPIFGNLNPNDVGRVTFNFQAKVDPALLNLNNRSN